MNYIPDNRIVIDDIKIPSGYRVVQKRSNFYPERLVGRKQFFNLFGKEEKKWVPLYFDAYISYPGPRFSPACAISLEFAITRIQRFVYNMNLPDEKVVFES
jgi:hypothetical protein